jgi:hypothetical protein
MLDAGKGGGHCGTRFPFAGYPAWAIISKRHAEETSNRRFSAAVELEICPKALQFVAASRYGASETAGCRSLHPEHGPKDGWKG